MKMIFNTRLVLVNNNNVLKALKTSHIFSFVHQRKL